MEDIKETIKKTLNDMFDDFVESKCADGEIHTHSNYVPYGDTYVNSGDYIDDDDIDQAKDDFIEWLEDEDCEVAKEILIDNELDETKENVEMVMEIARGI